MINILKKRTIHIIFILFILLSFSCSTKKNTFFRRSFHNITARYNVYFNGNESFKAGARKVADSETDNYTKIIPVFKYNNSTTVDICSGDMDNAIKKSAKLIKSHSITVKPKKKKRKVTTKKDIDFYNKSEFCNWVDDAYLLMGKAYLYKKEYLTAIKTFRHMMLYFRNEAIVYDAELWLARVYIEKGDYKEAENLLNGIIKDKKHPKELDKEIAIVYSHLFLQQKNYTEAIKKLEIIIPKTKRKKEKVRYKFILAQIYHKQEYFIEASNLYKEVIKLNPPYSMAFNAKIKRATAFSHGEDSKELKKQLNKMLRDEKNNDFHDQIYFALAQVEHKENNIEEAVEYYKLSAQNSVTNLNQKALSFLALADIFFKKPDYKNSALYYDSVMTYLDKDYSDYEAVSTKAMALSMLVKNLEIIRHQDSLQKIAKMPENERDVYIDMLIQKYIDDKKASANNQIRKVLPMDNTFNTRVNKGKWYFYNPNLLSYGRNEFTKRWGDRKLENNWRRRNKAIVMNITDDKIDDNTNPDEVAVDKRKKEYYLKELPLTKEELEKSNKKIVDAYFNSGEIYDININDRKTAIKTFEELNKRFPNNSYLLESYYYLYKLNNKIGNYERKEYYKNLIIQKFPDSEIAKMLSDPNFLTKLNNERKKISQLYEKAYYDYKNKNYESVISNYQLIEKNTIYKELLPKYLYIKALSYGHTGNKSQMLTTLEELVKKYPKDKITKIAISTIEVIKGGKYDMDIYKVSDNETHSYVVLYNNKDIDIAKLKFDIINFNLDFSKEIDLQITQSNINEHIAIIINPLKDKTIALEYMQMIVTKKIFEKHKLVNYYHFVISSSNLQIFKKDKIISKYNKFYKNAYE